MKIESIDRAFSNSQAETSQNKNISNKVQKEPIPEAKKTNLDSSEKRALPVAEKVVIEAIERANKAIEGARTEFRFSIHEQTHEISVKVLDKDSGEVIREIPPEKVLDMVARMWEMAGIIVDEKR